MDIENKQCYTKPRKCQSNISVMLAVLFFISGAYNIYIFYLYKNAKTYTFYSSTYIWPAIIIVGFTFLAAGIAILNKVARNFGIGLGCAGLTYWGIILYAISNLKNNNIYESNTCYVQFEGWSIFVLTCMLVVGLTIYYGYLCKIIEHELILITKRLESEISKKIIDNNNLLSGIESDNKTHAENLGKIIDKLNSANVSLETEKSSHLKTLEYRPYESQLVATFTTTLAREWFKLGYSATYSLSYLQGNYDRNFGDFVGLTLSKYWIVELKRDATCIKNETEKPLRKTQFTKLKTSLSPDLMNIASRCHYLGYGRSNSEETEVLFGSYWRFFQGKDDNLNTAASLLNHDQFVHAVFDPNTQDIGVGKIDFERYMRFLAQTSGDKGFNTDCFCVFAFALDATGRLRYWLVPNIYSVARVIEIRCRQVEQEQQDIKTRQATGRNRPDDPSMSRGPSLGR